MTLTHTSNHIQKIMPTPTSRDFTEIVQNLLGQGLTPGSNEKTDLGYVITFISSDSEGTDNPKCTMGCIVLQKVVPGLSGYITITMENDTKRSGRSIKPRRFKNSNPAKINQMIIEAVSDLNIISDLVDNVSSN